jgi:hypothetical protein
VPSAAALRPSSVAAYFQVTNGRPVRRLVSHASSGPAGDLVGQHAGLDVDPAARSTSAPPPACAVGVGAGHHDARDAGLEQRGRCRGRCGRCAGTARA